MSRKAVVASLASAIALGLAAFSAQAAAVPVSQGGAYSAGANLVQQAHYRYYRYHRHHRHWRWRHHRYYRWWW